MYCNLLLVEIKVIVLWDLEVIVPGIVVKSRITSRKVAKSGQINASFLEGVSGTSFGDTASRRILNTTNIIDPSYQLRCTAYMLRSKDKPVKCQLLLPTKHELYVSGRGAINTNCMGNCTTARI
ncbi:hypothetical protein DPMN_028390 [Dreissena polymorpha]|uniref:Uncharacterized protein n=1 Tax=Dreissena polymorpha TaxID=45954 RepID=A0A9D4REC1_DREPO|nr:hypothetical protein DPMN_028390 [Dreissena polymorpha]